MHTSPALDKEGRRSHDPQQASEAGVARAIVTRTEELIMS